MKKLYTYKKSLLKTLKGWNIKEQRKRVKLEAKRSGNIVKETRTSFNIYHKD
jgi:hypothetical protein